MIAIIIFALRYTQGLEPHPGPCELDNEINLFSVNPMYVKPHIVQMFIWRPHVLALQELRADKMVQLEVEHITKPCGFDCAWSNPTFPNSNRHCDEVGAALVAHSGLKQTTILAKSPEVTLLVESKRWVERAYTAENGLLFFVTCVYGYSGAKKMSSPVQAKRVAVPGCGDSCVY